MAASIDRYLQSLRGAFSQLPRGAAPAQTSPPPEASSYASMVSRANRQAPDAAYQAMERQALNGKQYGEMFPVGRAPYTPPPPAPPPAPAAGAGDRAPAATPYFGDFGGSADGNTGTDAGGNSASGTSGAGGTAGDGDGGAGGGWRGGRMYQRGGTVPPTEAQKHAGNYSKQHLSFHGLPISIETPKGATREGKDHTGKVWRCKMPADYGYIKRTEGADGDHLDVFVGPDRGSRMVFLINQNDHRTGKFDEHKAILGTTSERQAVALYCAAFSDGCGAKRIGSIEPMSLDAFKHWLKQGKTKTPAKAKTIVEHALAVTRSKT